MSADFFAGYLSGAAGIVIGNPLDLIKTRLQAGSAAEQLGAPRVYGSQVERASTLLRGVTAPILGYGALNAILFVTYNRSLLLLGDEPTAPSNAWKIWFSGAMGGLATFVVSAPTELVKCRAQVSHGETNSFTIAKDIWRQGGLRGMYFGGGVTSLRDAVGYGFYFWAYELSKQAISSPEDSDRKTAMKVLLCGGLAGVMTWTSVFPLDVIKTRVQTQAFFEIVVSTPVEEELLLGSGQSAAKGFSRRLGAVEVARRAYRSEGARVFFRGLGVCSVRAFVVNAVQWAVYEWMMRLLKA